MAGKAGEGGVGPPPGFVPIVHGAPFGALIGPIYEKPAEAGAIRGFRVAPKHTNARGWIHGGMLTTFADIVLAQVAFRSGVGRLVTVRLVTDFVANARTGDWVEGRARVTHRARTLVFISGEITAGARVLMTASGIFKVLDGAGGMGS
ncbi:MAG: PaaI family thioesterase [Alphaproteobacteria bacterium]|nr:PaaI family thioesterase [Alphaproteobacteria bacterium]